MVGLSDESGSPADTPRSTARAQVLRHHEVRIPPATPHGRTMEAVDLPDRFLRIVIQAFERERGGV
jgi:hypothetical protein